MLNLGTYRIELDGKWSLENFYELPHAFGQIYAFQYALFPNAEPRDSERLEEVFGAYPWRGGYSVVNFYRVIQGQVPPRGKPNVHSIQFASPGWIDLSLYVDVAQSVGQIVAIFVAAGLGLNQLYNSIHKGLSDRKLLRIRERRQRLSLRREELEFVTRSSEQIAKLMGFTGLEQLNGLTGDPLTTLKILLSYYRRVEILADYERNDKAHFPK